MRSIEIWGIYPPPIGGVTIHLKRLFHSLENKTNVYFVDFGETGKKYPSKHIRHAGPYITEVLRLLFGKKKTIHLHSFSILLAVCFILFGWRHRYGVTIHNQRAIRITSGIQIRIYTMFLRSCNFIIMNDANYANKFSDFFSVSKDKITILPAFITPLESEKKGLPNEILQFRNSHQFLLSGNAFKLNKENGVDVYGLDMMIELISNLRNQGIDAGLLFCLPVIGDECYYNALQDRIRDNGLEEHIFFVQNNVDNAFEYWAIADLFLRPTLTDMEGISVKEALCVGTNVVASDVCIRPKECYVFKNRDFDDFYNVVHNFYNRKLYHKKMEFTSVDTPTELLKIYHI